MGNWPQKVSVSTKEPSQTFSPLQLVKVFTVWLSDKAMRQLVERMNQSQVFLTNSEKFVFGEVIPPKAGNCLNEESIHISSSIVTDVDILSSLRGCSQYPLTIIIESCNRGYAESWILMKSSQANSQLRNQSQVINIFLRTKWINMKKDKRQWETLPATGLLL